MTEPVADVNRADQGGHIGRFVVIVGPDGVGKTSLAAWLLEAWQGRAGYFHFITTRRRPLETWFDPNDQVIPPKPPKTGSRLLGCMRLLRNLPRFWFAYATIIRPEIRRGSLIIGDRWAYGYVAQPTGVRFYGPPWLAYAVVRLLPRPDLVINLTAPAEVIHERKEELSIEEIGAELELWKTVSTPRREDVDASRSPTEIAHHVLALIEGLDREP
jgi:thymidylate kinase